jgi:hypothetical protein
LRKVQIEGTSMDGKMARLWRTLAVHCLIAPLAGCACLPTHGQALPPAEPATIFVSGMVKTPGIMPIPSGGLTLRDAVGLAGGDLPETWFRVSSLYLLVTLERSDSAHHFSLPLVTADDAGKILLRAGDKVIVRPWYQTDLSRLSKTDSQTMPDSTDVPEFTPLVQELMLPLLGINDPNVKKVDFKIVTSRFGADATVKTLSYDWSTKSPAGKIPTVASELQFASAISQDQTVCVLRRIKNGRLEEFVLLRRNPRYISGFDADMSKVLRSIVMAPNDHLSVDILQRLPVVLASLLANPQLMGPAAALKGGPECLPKVHETAQEVGTAVHTLLAPAAQALDHINDVVTPPLQNLGGALLGSPQR